MPVSLEVSGELYVPLIRHLLRPHGVDEEAAFLFTRSVSSDRGLRLVAEESILLAPDAFSFRSARYLELTDLTQRMLIKRAHELGAGLVEVHSHPKFGAEFSGSDKQGLREFVPHVWWRLKGKPYAAIVVAPHGFDALAWVADPRVPQMLESMLVDGVTKHPTGLSLPRWDEEDEHVRESF
jgi:hypothetical protein